MKIIIIMDFLSKKLVGKHMFLKQNSIFQCMKLKNMMRLFLLNKVWSQGPLQIRTLFAHHCCKSNILLYLSDMHASHHRLSNLRYSTRHCKPFMFLKFWNECLLSSSFQGIAVSVLFAWKVRCPSHHKHVIKKENGGHWGIWNIFTL